MPRKTRNDPKIPFVVFLVVLALLLPKIFHLTLSNLMGSTVEYSESIKDDVVSYELGGTVTGLHIGETLILRNNQEQISLFMNGEFFFKKRLHPNDIYDVRVEQHPKNQHCYVINGLSQIKGKRPDILNLRVLCNDINNLADTGYGRR